MTMRALLISFGAAQNQNGIAYQNPTQPANPSMIIDGSPEQSGFAIYDGEKITLPKPECTPITILGLSQTDDANCELAKGCLGRFTDVQAVNRKCLEVKCGTWSWDASGTEYAYFYSQQTCATKKTATGAAGWKTGYRQDCYVDWVLGQAGKDCNAVCADHQMQCQETGFGQDGLRSFWTRNIVAHYNKQVLKPKCGGDTGDNPDFQSFGVAPVLWDEDGRCKIESPTAPATKDLWCNRTAPVVRTHVPDAFTKQEEGSLLCPDGQTGAMSAQECEQAANFLIAGGSTYNGVVQDYHQAPAKCYVGYDGNFYFNDIPGDGKAWYNKRKVCKNLAPTTTQTIYPGFASRCAANAHSISVRYQRICPCAKAADACAMPAGKDTKGDANTCVFDQPPQSYSPRYVYYTGGQPDTRVDATEAPAYSDPNYDPVIAESPSSANYTGDGVYGSTAKYDYVDPRSGTVMAPPPALTNYPYLPALKDGSATHAGYYTDYENAGNAYWKDGDTKVSGGPGGNNNYLQNADGQDLNKNNQNPGNAGAGIPQDKSCTGQGMVCDFTDITEMAGKSYTPFDFVWKIIDPTDWYLTNAYNMRTLNCEVKIQAASQSAARSYHHFYIPLGAANKDQKFSSNGYEWCDVNGILREINNDDLEMKDRIRVRAETARVNNKGDSAMDLVGEFFDLTCSCKTKLQTMANLEMIHNYGSLSTVMQGTDQSRVLDVELHLFSDSMLTDRVTMGLTGNEPSEPFPTWSERFYFLARHTYDNDWDVMLQINKCVVCDMVVHQRSIDQAPGVTQGPACRTDVANDEAVTFFENCDFVIGGPQGRPANASSWYWDDTMPAITWMGTSGSSAPNVHDPPARTDNNKCSANWDFMPNGPSGDTAGCWTDWKPTGSWGDSNSNRDTNADAINAVALGGELSPHANSTVNTKKRCPYHVIGMQKFGIVGASQIYVSCAITACTDRPCLPCSQNYYAANGDNMDRGPDPTVTELPGGRRQSSRRSLSFKRSRLLEKSVSTRRRKLQAAEFGTSELAMGIRFAEGDQGKMLGGSGKDSKKKRKNSIHSTIVLLLIVLILAVVAASIMRKLLEKKQEQKQRTVLPEKERSEDMKQVTQH